MTVHLHKLYINCIVLVVFVIVAVDFALMPNFTQLIFIIKIQFVLRAVENACKQVTQTPQPPTTTET